LASQMPKLSHSCLVKCVLLLSASASPGCSKGVPPTVCDCSTGRHLSPDAGATAAAVGVAAAPGASVPWESSALGTGSAFGSFMGTTVGFAPPPIDTPATSGAACPVDAAAAAASAAACCCCCRATRGSSGEAPETGTAAGAETGAAYVGAYVGALPNPAGALPNPAAGFGSGAAGGGVATRCEGRLTY